jgi:hypothetical protein
MTTVQSCDGAVTSQFVVTAKRWEESTNGDYGVICTDSAGQEFRGFVTLNGPTAFESADLYIEPHGPIARDDWKFGDDWQGTLLERSFGL